MVEVEVEETEESNQQFKYKWKMCRKTQHVKVPTLVDISNNLKQKEKGRSRWWSMDQSKDMVETKIDELLT